MPITLYHVSFNLNEPLHKEFIPRIPDNRPHWGQTPLRFRGCRSSKGQLQEDAGERRVQG